MSQPKKIRGTFTEIVPAFLVRGTAIVALPGGRKRRVHFSRIIPAGTPEAARVAGLQRVVRDLGGAELEAARPRWSKVTARWIANQYMWVFDEEDAGREMAQAPQLAQGGN